MNKDNKIISFDEKILEREQEDYIVSMRISLFYFPIIGQKLMIRTTLKKTDTMLLEVLVLLEEARKILINKGITPEVKPEKIGIQRFVIEFYMTSNEDVYFYSDTDDEPLMSVILISIASIKEIMHK